MLEYKVRNVNICNIINIIDDPTTSTEAKDQATLSKRREFTRKQISNPKGPTTMNPRKREKPFAPLRFFFFLFLLSLRHWECMFLRQQYETIGTHGVQRQLHSIGNVTCFPWPPFICQPLCTRPTHETVDDKTTKESGRKKKGEERRGERCYRVYMLHACLSVQRCNRSKPGRRRRGKKKVSARRRWIYELHERSLECAWRECRLFRGVGPDRCERLISQRGRLSFIRQACIWDAAPFHKRVKLFRVQRLKARFHC